MHVVRDRGRGHKETAERPINACGAVEERRFSAAKASEIKSGFSHGGPGPHCQRVFRNLSIRAKKAGRAKRPVKVTLSNQIQSRESIHTLFHY